MAKSRAGGGRAAGGGIAGPRTVDARALGISITRETRANSLAGTRFATFTFTRNNQSNRFTVQTQSSTAGIRLSASEALADAVRQFNQFNNVALTNLPRVRDAGTSFR